MKVHVHIYRVIAKAEFDIENAVGLDGASTIALSKAKANELVFSESDCEFITLPFEMKDG